jgi:peptidoglycan/xylan/chitin deacetylase (PgdA/CDA1 family)
MTARPLRVLMYHRILDPAASGTRDPALISATPREFERQMRHIARWYTPVSEAQLLESIREGRPLPRRAVLVTFDDACRDFADTARWSRSHQNCRCGASG